MKNYFIAVLLVASSTYGAFAQTLSNTTTTNTATSTTAPKSKFPKPKTFSSWSLGFKVGPMLAHTDITPTVGGDNLGDYEMGFGYGLFFSRSFTHTFALQAEFDAGSIKSSDKLTFRGVKTDLEFSTKINYQVSLNGVFTLGNISYLKKMLPNVNFYLSGGIGLMKFDPTLKFGGKEVGDAAKNDSLLPAGMHSWGPTSELVFPFAVGARYKIGKSFTVNIEYNLENTWTDKLDGRRVPLSSLDRYSFINFGATYIFGKKEKAIEWTNPLEEVYTELGQIRSKMDSLIGDKDGDGVADLYDKDMATPAGVKVYGDGTTADTDGDGFADAADSEVFSPRGCKVDGTGKEVDADGDGVGDTRDLEPNTDKSLKANFQGIGIVHNESGGGGGAGILGFEKYLPIVFFDFNKYNVKSQYNEGLAALARIMNVNTGAIVTLFGHCDVKGSESLNNKLGDNRANAVKDYLVKVYGIDGNRIKTESKGKSEPFSNKANTKDQDPLNRRVDYKIN